MRCLSQDKLPVHLLNMSKKPATGIIPDLLGSRLELILSRVESSMVVGSIKKECRIIRTLLLHQTAIVLFSLGRTSTTRQGRRRENRVCNLCLQLTCRSQDLGHKRHENFVWIFNSYLQRTAFTVSSICNNY